MNRRQKTTVRSSFAISGFECEPADVTSALGLCPDRTSTEKPDKSGFKYWEFKTRGIDTVFVDAHIDKIIQILTPSSSALRENPIFKTQDIELNIFIVAKVSERDVGVRMALKPAASKFLADHNISIVIDG